MSSYRTREELQEANETFVSPDAEFGPQGAALIVELRRLQKLLDHENRTSLEAACSSADTKCSKRPAMTRASRRRRPSRPGVSRTVEVCLGMLGLKKHFLRTPKTVETRHTIITLPKDAARRDTSAVVLQLPPKKPRQTPTETVKRHSLERQSGSERQWTAIHVRDPGNVQALRRAVDRLPSLFATVTDRLKRLRAPERIRLAWLFLLGQDRGDTPDYGANAALCVRLTRNFEDELRSGLRVLIVGIGLLGGWAAFVPLSGAVVLPGTLVVESDVKKIQHPAGGVVASIPVRDGMHVAAGDLLLRLDETQLRANHQVLTQQLDQVRARRARLLAERDGLEEPKAPPELARRLKEEAVQQLWTSEVQLFQSRAAARRSAKELLQGRIAQLGEQISGLDAQVSSKSAQRDLISGELEGVESLFQKGLVPLTRKTSLQREAARLDGERGQAAAAIAEARSKIGEAQLQAVRIDQDFRAEVMKELREAQDKESELLEKTVAAQDLLARVELRAPTSGVVHQLAVHTVGGVVAPGDVIMEIVPESDELQIEAKLPPRNIDQVHRGQKTFVRFSAFNQRTTPELEGVVSFVSADLTYDRQTNAGYYTVRVTLPAEERHRVGNLQLISGMPAEVFLQTGSRTMLSYLFKPITDQLLRTFK